MTLRELLAHVGEQGLLVFSAILAMPFLIPVSLPFMSTALGLPMLLIGIAVILGRLPWLPARLLDHELPAVTVQHVLGRARRTAERFEHLVKPRLHALTGSTLVNSLHGVTMVIAVLLLMAPLPFVPFANTLPAIAIILALPRHRGARRAAPVPGLLRERSLCRLYRLTAVAGGAGRARPGRRAQRVQGVFRPDFRQLGPGKCTGDSVPATCAAASAPLVYNARQFAAAQSGSAPEVLRWE